MSVVGFAQERPDSPESSFEMGKHTITRRFLVQTNSLSDGPYTVALAIGIPGLFTPYYYGAEFNPFCLVRSIEPKRVKPASLFWDVVVKYETPEVKGAGGGLGSGGRDGGESDKGGTGVDNKGEYQNPLLEIPEVETHFETQQQVMYGCFPGTQVMATIGSNTVTPTNTSSYYYTVGDPVILSAVSLIANMSYGGVLQNTGPSLATTITAINTTSGDITLATPWPYATQTVTFTDMSFQPIRASNGEPFNPPPNRDESKLILSITRNEALATPHPALAVAYQDCVNSDVFWGADPGMVKVSNITVRRETRQLASGTTVAYLRCSYVFHIKGSWDVQLLNKGTYYWTTDSRHSVGAKQQAFKSADGQPIDGLLTANGGKLADGATPTWLYARPYNWKPFAFLNLPQSFMQVQ